MKINEIVKMYRTYRGIEGRARLQNDHPDIYEKRMEYHSGWIHKGEFLGYDDWLFDYLFKEWIE